MGLGVAGGQILAFPIDIDRRPYNTLALTCECVISLAVYDLFVCTVSICSKSNKMAGVVHFVSFRERFHRCIFQPFDCSIFSGVELQ